MTHLTSDDTGIIVNCDSCGKANRLPFARLQAEAHCGSCKATLSAPAAPIDIDSTGRFDTLVKEASLPVLVDFWARWCGPCVAVAPEFDKVAHSMRGKWLVAKVDTDRLPDLAARFGIRSIPTMAVFRGGVEAGRTVGAMPAAGIVQFVERSLS